MKILVSTLMKDVQLNESLRFYHNLFGLNDRLSEALLESVDFDDISDSLRDFIGSIIDCIYDIIFPEED